MKILFRERDLLSLVLFLRMLKTTEHQVKLLMKKN